MYHIENGRLCYGDTRLFVKNELFLLIELAWISDGKAATVVAHGTHADVMTAEKAYSAMYAPVLSTYLERLNVPVNEASTLVTLNLMALAPPDVAAAAANAILGTSLSGRTFDLAEAVSAGDLKRAKQEIRRLAAKR